MSQQIRKVWVCGIYNWSASTTKEVRMTQEYPRFNWCDIDTTNIDNYNAVLNVFKKYNTNCVSQRCGKGWHFFGDLVSYEIWQRIWDEIRPYADPKWAPHTMRVSKKRIDEVWERPIYHKHKSDPPNWARSLMHFLCKALRNENSTDLWVAMRKVGLDKHFQVTVYPIEIII